MLWPVSRQACAEALRAAGFEAEERGERIFVSTEGLPEEGPERGRLLALLAQLGLRGTVYGDGVLAWPGPTVYVGSRAE